MKIKLSDINIRPCEKYYDLIVENYGKDGEFDPIEVFNAVNSVDDDDNIAGDVEWLLRHCEKARTQEMFEYFIRLDPGIVNTTRLIYTCEEARTKEMLEYYIGIESSPAAICFMVNKFDFTRTMDEPERETISKWRLWKRLTSETKFALSSIAISVVVAACVYAGIACIIDADRQTNVVVAALIITISAIEAALVIVAFETNEKPKGKRK